jgi:hypothetical protein
MSTENIFAGSFYFIQPKQIALKAPLTFSRQKLLIDSCCRIAG